MNENNTLIKLQDELVILARRTNTLRHNFAGIKSLDSMAAMITAHDIAMIGQEFLNISVALKQAAIETANERHTYKPKLTAKSAAKALRRRGSYSVAA